MKVKHDDELPAHLKSLFIESVGISKSISEKLTADLTDSFRKDERFYCFTYSDALSYILKIYSLIFIDGLNYAHFVGSHFPDNEINANEIFEDALKGLRTLTNIKEPTKEYINGIKKL
jgi:hypothetical protein